MLTHLLTYNTHAHHHFLMPNAQADLSVGWFPRAAWAGPHNVGLSPSRSASRLPWGYCRLQNPLTLSAGHPLPNPNILVSTRTKSLRLSTLLFQARTSGQDNFSKEKKAICGVVWCPGKWIYLVLQSTGVWLSLDRAWRPGRSLRCRPEGQWPESTGPSAPRAALLAGQDVEEF